MKPTATQTQPGWSPPAMPTNFSLQTATKKATYTAVAYMNQVLHSNDMAVFLEAENTEQPVGKVVDLLDGSSVQNYDHLQILKLYAHRKNLQGLIVDGRV